MTDKEIIKEQANIDISNLRTAQEQGIITEFGRGELEALEGIVDFIDSLQEEPVSEPNEQLAKTYLTVFDKKFPILPTLKGKQLADYKNFLNKCQQIFGLKEWGIRPIQSKLFEKLTLLWAAWGAEHLQGVGKQDEKEQDIPVSEDLEEAAEDYCKSTLVGSPYIKKNAFKAGAKWQKEQMMKDAITAQCFGFQGAALFSFKLPAGSYLVGSKVKVIVINED